MTDKEGKSMSLRAEQSRVSIAGLARIHEATLERLGLKERAPIVVTKGEKAILVHVYSDQLVDKNTIRLKKIAMGRLDAKEGDNVLVTPHVTYIESMKGAAAGIKKKWNERRKHTKRR